MSQRRLFILVRPYLGISLGWAILAGFFFLVSVTLPQWISKYRPPAQIEILRQQERLIQNQFKSLLNNLLQRGRQLSSSLPQELPEIRRAFLSLNLNPEREGVVYLKEKTLPLWHGQVIPPSLLPPADGASHIVRYKASVFLAATFLGRQEEKLAFLSLLSFTPPLATPLLRPYYFFEKKGLENVLIDFYEDEDDISGFEKIFARHQDEYISQPRSRTDILTIFFPLRNEGGRISATVNLRSPTPGSQLREQKERWQQAGWVALLAFFLTSGGAAFVAWKKAQFQAIGCLCLCLFSLIGLRLTILRLTNFIDSLPSFLSPSLASLPFFSQLLSSPLDILLSSAALFFILFFIIIDRRRLLFSSNLPKISFTQAIFSSFLSLVSFLPIFGFFRTTSLIVFNSNTHLLRFSPLFPSLLIFLGLALLLATAILLSFLCLHLSQRFWPYKLPKGLTFLSLFGLFLGFHFLCPEISLIQTLVILLIIFGLHLCFLWSKFWKKPIFRLSVFALVVAFFHLSLYFNLSIKEKRLTEGFLRDSILSQEIWVEYLVQESLPELEKEQTTIINFLREAKEGKLANLLWQGTPLARWNWYSSLEIIRPDGQILSRFSLNLPLLFRPTISLAPSEDWSLLRATLPFPGREKNFIIAYRDYKEDSLSLGRLVLYALLDEEMLSFLYSAIPYFDLLRFPSSPSLKEFNFNLAIFKSEGQIVFNPAQITTGIPPKDLKRLKEQREKAFWSSLNDRGRRFQVYYFWNQEKIVAILWPSPRFISIVVNYLKFLFLWFILTYIPVFLFGLSTGRLRLATLFWTFSSRVYASFVAIILILFIPFTLLVQNFFTRMAQERFSEKAEIQARVARNIIEDFIFFQEEEETAPLPIEDLVLWVSTAINNDVNIYQDGQLVASSRQEFFDSGILPDFLDGEVAYRLQYERQPYVVWRKKIGDYSFQTLTIPFNLNGSLFLVSLPFPMERQELARSQEELLEFLGFISAISLILVILFARSIGSLVISPVRKLLVATREVSSGNLDVFIEHGGHDEMQELIEGFNRMVQNLKKHQRELAEMSKKAAWAEMARKVAHEIKNPLTPIRLSAEHLLRVHEERPEEMASALKESISYIISEVENLRRIAQDFLAFSREGPIKKRPLELGKLIKETIHPYERVISSRIIFDFKLEDEITLMGDREKLKIAFRNLIVNAIEAIKGKGTIKIQVEEEEGMAVVAIIDTGEGMASDTLSRVFEPDFSTKDLGTGLGLPIAKKIIEDHGGCINLTSRLGLGTEVKICLPSGQKPE